MADTQNLKDEYFEELCQIPHGSGNVEKISDYLKILGATKAVLYFEDVRIYREQKNQTNRLNNMEQANMDKVIRTATTQLEEIEIIEENDGVMLLDDKVKEVLEYRKKYPEASLKELLYLSKEFWGKGIYKEILPYMIKVAFEEIKTKNFRGYAKERNIASIKVLEKSNFILEKIFEVDGIEEKIYSFLITRTLSI